MRLKSTLIFILLLLFTTVCSQFSQQTRVSAMGTQKYNEGTIIFATDLHYYSPSLTDQGALFQDIIKNGDGKTIQYSPQIVSAFIDQVIEIHPDALVLGGDLSFNGELKSHEDLAQLFQKVKDAGIPVLTVPGNHDINRPNTYSYMGDQAIATTSISHSEFWNFYAPLGANRNISRDPNSLSYIYPLSKEMQLLMIDTSQHEPGRVKDSGKISKKTYDWIESNLERAEKKGTTVISVSHHNLLEHNPLFTSTFTIQDNKKLVKLLEKHDVALNLSGHMHIQHVTEIPAYYGIVDIATNALTANPNLFAQVTIKPHQSISYKTQSVNVSAWALKENIDNPDLLDFSNYAENFFKETTRVKTSEILDSYEFSAEKKESMIVFAEKLNTQYFAGTLSESRQAFLKDPAYTSWVKHLPDYFFTDYMKKILKDKSQENNEVTIKLRW